MSVHECPATLTPGSTETIYFDSPRDVKARDFTITTAGTFSVDVIVPDLGGRARTISVVAINSIGSANEVFGPFVYLGNANKSLMPGQIPTAVPAGLGHGVAATRGTSVEGDLALGALGVGLLGAAVPVAVRRRAATRR